MQPDIPALDRFFITYSSNGLLRLMVWLLAAAVPVLTQNIMFLWVAALPLILDAYGLWVIRQTHDLLNDKLCEAMTTEGCESCGLDDDAETFCMQEPSGQLKRLLLKTLPDMLDMTLIAPQENFAVISHHSGTIFPPRWLHPLEFIHHAKGQTEIYYADVNYVEFEDDTLTLHFSNGKTLEIEGGDGADKAVTALRKRLREHKSLPNNSKSQI